MRALSHTSFLSSSLNSSTYPAPSRCRRRIYIVASAFPPSLPIEEPSSRTRVNILTIYRVESGICRRKPLPSLSFVLRGYTGALGGRKLVESDAAGCAHA